jgi:hypothetical protein
MSIDPAVQLRCRRLRPRLPVEIPIPRRDHHGGDGIADGVGDRSRQRHEAIDAD